jgi:tRNA pseudouridine55 synthase
MSTKYAVNSAEVVMRGPRVPEFAEAWKRCAARYLNGCAMKSPSPYDGVLLIDKKPGMTSHDVVLLVRNCLETQKVGHCGTLDPFATGLLLIVVGRGTKIQDLLMSEDKEYVGTMRLGEVTDTQDRDGTTIETHEVGALDKSTIDAAFAKFHGDFYQTPPMVSAIKREGVPLYKLARQGKVVEREARFVHVYAHEIRAIRPQEIDFRVICSKGFYVRTYAHEIGKELGCGAHLSELRRTKSGRFSVEGALTIDALKAGPKESVAEQIISLPDISRMRGA